MTSAAQRAKQAFPELGLREIRQDAGLTGRQLAELTGFHFTKISRVEHGAQGLQRVLRSGDHQFMFLLAEQTLYTRIGTVEAMVEQLDPRSSA